MTHVKKDAYALIFREYPDVVSISQLSQMLCVCEKTAYRLLKDNKIEHFKIGRTYRIPKINVIAYMTVNT